MKIIDGKNIAQEIYNRLRARPVPKKFMAGVVVGGDRFSLGYQKAKQKAALALNVDYRINELEDASAQDLHDRIEEIASIEDCGGVVVQLPLPTGRDKDFVCSAILKEKDPDVLSPSSTQDFIANKGLVLPPAVGALKEVVFCAGMDLKKSKIGIVGLGSLVGQPILAWLKNSGVNVAVLGKGFDKSSLADLDVLVLGAGVAGLVTAGDIKEGALVVDFGYSRNADGVVCGDFDVFGHETKGGFYTPTPGGTGPIVIAKLIENFYNLQNGTY